MAIGYSSTTTNISGVIWASNNRLLDCLFSNLCGLNWPLTRYVNLWVAHAPEHFPRLRHQRKPLVSDLGMLHVTCVTHVPWCMSLTRGGGEKIPDITGACATRNFTYLARGPLNSIWLHGSDNSLWSIGFAWQITFSDMMLLAMFLSESVKCERCVLKLWELSYM